MTDGKAIQQTWIGGTPDFPGKPLTIITMSAGGPGKLIDCQKCHDCGFSVTKA